MATTTLSPAATVSSGHVTLAAPAGVLRLEALLNDVLKRSLDELLTQRDALYTQVAQCEQLCALFREMTALSRYHSHLTPDAATTQPTLSTTTDDDAHARGATGEDSGAHMRDATTGDATRVHARARSDTPQRNHILVDIGCHMYAPAVVREASCVHVNLGCGVVLPMHVDDAARFMQKKQSVLRERAQRLTREVLRVKYRIRLVTEAIARLHERGITQPPP